MGVDPTPQVNLINSAKLNTAKVDLLPGLAMPVTVPPPKVVEDTQTPSEQLLPPVELNNTQSGG